MKRFTLDPQTSLSCAKCAEIFASPWRRLRVQAKYNTLVTASTNRNVKVNQHHAGNACLILAIDAIEFQSPFSAERLAVALFPDELFTGKEAPTGIYMSLSVAGIGRSRK